MSVLFDPLRDVLQRPLTRPLASVGAGVGGGDPGGGGGGTGSLMLIQTDGDVTTAYPVSRDTGLGASLGSYDASIAGESFVHSSYPIPGYLLFGVGSASGGAIAATPAAPGAFAKIPPGNVVTLAGGNVAALAGRASDGMIFAITLEAASEVSTYSINAARVNAGTLELVGNPLTGNYGFDSSLGSGAEFRCPQPKVMGGHFCTIVTNVSTGRSGARSLFAYSFDGTDFTLEDTFDMTDANWYAIWQGPDFVVFGNSFGASPDLRFVRYTAAGGYTSFDVLNADLAGPTDTINNIQVDQATGRLFIGVSDSEYTEYAMRVLEPNFTTGELDLVTVITGISEMFMYPGSVADNFMLMPRADWDTGFQLVQFTGTGFTAIGAETTIGDAKLVLVPDPA